MLVEIEGETIVASGPVGVNRFPNTAAGAKAFKEVYLTLSKEQAARGEGFDIPVDLGPKLEEAAESRTGFTFAKWCTSGREAA